MAASEESLSGMKDEKEHKEGELETTLTEIAEAQEELLNLQAELKDNQTYMKDLTEQCELKAREWDQQTKMRADELKALNKAIEIMVERVSPQDVVNERALLQKAKLEGKKPAAAAPPVEANMSDDDVA